MESSAQSISCIAPPACLTLGPYRQLRDAAPARCKISSDEFATVVSAGGPRAYEVPWHSHDCLMLLLPHSGAINFREEARRSGSWISEDRFVVVPKSRIHTGKSNNAPHLVFYVTDAWLERVGSYQGSMPNLRRHMRTSSSFAVTPEIRMLRELCRTMSFDAAPAPAALGHVVTALLLMMFAQIEKSEALPNSERRGHGDAVVQDICALIASCFDKDLPLDEVADTFGVSRRHVTRIFRDRTGLSIAEYHESVRIDAAVRLLTETDLTVSEVAMRVGYDSGSALARAFRRLLACAPSAFRNSDAFSVRRTPVMRLVGKQTPASRAG